MFNFYRSLVFCLFRKMLHYNKFSKSFPKTIYYQMLKSVFNYRSIGQTRRTAWPEVVFSMVQSAGSQIQQLLKILIQKGIRFFCILVSKRNLVEYWELIVHVTRTVNIHMISWFNQMSTFVSQPESGYWIAFACALTLYLYIINCYEYLYIPYKLWTEIYTWK